MRHFPTTAVCLLLIALSGPLAAQDEATWSGNATLLIGSRHLDDDDLWQPDDTLNALGIEVDFARSNWPINVVVGFELTKGNAEGLVWDPVEQEEGWSDVEVEIFQLDAGVQRYFRQEKRLRPYVGGSLTLLRAERELSGFADVRKGNDNSIGAVAKAGVRVNIGRGFSVGGDVRYVLGTDLKLLDQSGDADGFQFSGALSWGW